MEWLETLIEETNRRIHDRHNLPSGRGEGPDWIEIPVEELRSGDELPPATPGGDNVVVWSVYPEGDLLWEGPVVKVLRSAGEAGLGVSPHLLDHGDRVQVLARNTRNGRGL